MKIIVSVDSNWAIGSHGGLLYKIPKDLANFRELTWGNPIIYGRNTLATFPKGRPLPSRENIILSTQKDLVVPGAVVVSSIAELKKSSVWDFPNTFVVGGASVYKQLLPYCDEAIVTMIEGVNADADAFFPSLYEDTDWFLVKSEKEGDYRGLKYHVNTFVRCC